MRRWKGIRVRNSGPSAETAKAAAVSKRAKRQARNLALLAGQSGKAKPAIRGVGQ